MPTFDDLYAFLREYYLHSRFEGSLSLIDFPDYPQIVTMSSMEQLSATGVGYISKFESRTGRTIIFSPELKILNPDEPPAQIKAPTSHLTHIPGA